MSTARIVIAMIFICMGVFFSIVSVFGTFRFKFVLNRMHAAAMGDTLAILFVLLGLILISGFNFTSLKLAVIIVFFWIASPVSSHLISNLVATVDRRKVLEMCEMIDIENNKKEQEKENEETQ